jgi:hypothetical protein
VNAAFGPARSRTALSEKDTVSNADPMVLAFSRNGVSKQTRYDGLKTRCRITVNAARRHHGGVDLIESGLLIHSTRSRSATPADSRCAPHRRGSTCGSACEPGGRARDVSAERTVGPIDVVVVTAVDGHRKPGVWDKHGLRTASGGNLVGDRDEHDDLPSLPFEHARG